MTGFVLDCSIAVSWCFEDEASEDCDALLERVRDEGGKQRGNIASYFKKERPSLPVAECVSLFLKHPEFFLTGKAVLISGKS